MGGRVSVDRASRCGHGEPGHLGRIDRPEIEGAFEEFPEGEEDEAEQGLPRGEEQEGEGGGGDPGGQVAEKRAALEAGRVRGAEEAERFEGELGREGGGETKARAETSTVPPMRPKVYAGRQKRRRVSM